MDTFSIARINESAFEAILSSSEDEIVLDDSFIEPFILQEPDRIRTLVGPIFNLDLSILETEEFQKNPFSTNEYNPSRDIRERARTVSVPVKTMFDWFYAFKADREAALRPDWWREAWNNLSPKDRLTTYCRYRNFGEIAQLERIDNEETEIAIYGVAKKIGISKRTVEKFISRYRQAGFMGLAPGYDPYKLVKANKADFQYADIGALKDDEFKELLAIHESIKHLINKPATEEEVKKVAQKQGVSVRKVRYQISAFREGKPTKLLRHPRSDEDTDHSTSQKMRKIILGLYSWNPFLTIAEIKRQADLRALLLGEVPPHYLKVRSIIKSIPEPERAFLTGDDKIFNNNYRVTGRIRFSRDWIVVQLDTTTIPVMMKDIRKGRKKKKSGMVRGYLTIAYCPNFDLILGFRVTYTVPDRYDVGSVVHQSMTWSPDKPYNGIADEYWVDRGKQYIAEYVQQIFRDVETILKLLRPYSPQLKGRCERVFRSFETLLFSRMVGYVTSNLSRRKKWKRNVLPTIDQVEKEIRDFITYRNNRMKQKTGNSPVADWAASGVIPRTIPEKDLAILLKERKTLTVIKGELRYRGRIYRHQNLAKHVDETVIIRAQPSNATPDEIIVFDVDKHFICTAYASDSKRGLEETDADVAHAKNIQRGDLKEKRDVYRESLDHANLQAGIKGSFMLLSSQPPAKRTAKPPSNVPSKKRVEFWEQRAAIRSGHSISGAAGD